MLKEESNNIVAEKSQTQWIELKKSAHKITVQAEVHQYQAKMNNLQVNDDDDDDNNNNNHNDQNEYHIINSEKRIQLLPHYISYSNNKNNVVHKQSSSLKSSSLTNTISSNIYLNVSWFVFIPDLSHLIDLTNKFDYSTIMIMKKTNAR